MATAADFQTPWEDLADRLARATDSLSDLIGAADGDNRDRLIAKRAAVEEALIVHGAYTRALVGQAQPDHAWAWRSFTDDMRNCWLEALSAAHQEGYALALGYQRGYARDIDAPVLTVLVGKENVQI